MDMESDAAKKAEEELNKLVQRGVSRGAQLLNTIKENVIVPYMVYTKDMAFHPAKQVGASPEYIIDFGDEVVPYDLHKHALSQMAGEVKIPVSFVNTLTQGADWERRELSDLLDERFRKLDFTQRGGGLPRFINLAVKGQIRGFVSRSFKRYLRSGPIFEAFIIACKQLEALPVDAIVSDLNLTLRCVLPYVFELKRGHHVALGLSCSNSDFGAGTFRIGLTSLNLATGATSYVRTIKEERHVGSADKDTDQTAILSEETLTKKISALKSEIQDVVREGLSPVKVNEFLDLVRKSMDKEVSWPKLVSYLQGKLTSAEVKELEEILKDSSKSAAIADIDYDVNNEAILTLWWASNAVSSIASRYEGDKKEELEAAAGGLILKAG